jgi:hypothetical protein
MQQTCFAVPLQAGQTAAARAFLRELEHARKAAYAASERRLGIAKEVWALQAAPPGDLFVVYIESDDVGRAFHRFAASQDPFDRWFKTQLAALTGVDLNTPPPGPLSEVLSVYSAQRASVRWARRPRCTPW